MKQKSHKVKQSKKVKHEKHSKKGKHTKSHWKKSKSKQHKSGTKRKFNLKGKMPPKPKGQPFNQTPSMMTPEQMTTIYQVPSEHFKTEEDVATYNGYKIMNEIARGGFAIIYKSKNIKTGHLAALKLVNLGDDPTTNSSRISEMKNELFIMEMVDNTFAIKLYLHYLVNNNLYIFMQFAEAGSFGKLLETSGVLDEKDSKYYFAQMCCGVEHMHELSIAHRDIKPANFLMAEHQNGQKIVLISDYGLSRIVHKDEKGNPVLYSTQCGTPAYMAPEILSGQEYNSYLVDVWSLGVTLYAMLNLMTPFDVNQDDYGVKEMMNSEWQFTDAMKENPSEGLQSIMGSMLEPDPTKRSTMKQMVAHAWLKADYEKVKQFERVQHK